MKRKKEKVPGFDEIIFENRNKEYGAYDIRRHYLPATLWSIITGSVIFTALMTILAVFSEKEASAGSENPIIVVVTTDPSITDPNKLKPEDPDKPEIKPEIRVMGPPVITNDTAEITTMLIADQMLDSVKNNPVTMDDTLKYTPDPPFTPEPEPGYFLEEMPLFPGGETELLKFINDNIKYPEEAAVNGVQGRVVLRFVVATDGSIKRIEIFKGVHPVLDQEAVRVLSMMPKWKPGRQNGIPASVWFMVPVTFKLKEN
jgi:protein TonB